MRAFISSNLCHASLVLHFTLPLALFTALALSFPSSLPSLAMSTAAPVATGGEPNASPLPLTPEEVAATDTISSLTLSPDARQVVYTVRPHYLTKEHATSALWVADTAVENSARKLSSGVVNDNSPAFHPVSGDVYFLSDRGGIGERSSIYKLQADATLGTEPVLAVALAENQIVVSFEVSPDGNLLAFIAKTVLSEAERKSKGPGRLWRDKTDLASLYVAELHYSRVHGPAGNG